VDQYGVHFDAALRDQVQERYRKLNLPTYFAGVNADLVASFKTSGEVDKVEIRYWDDPAKQYLDYGAMWDPSLSSEAKK
jgi:hypothetical protein